MPGTVSDSGDTLSSACTHFTAWGEHVMATISMPSDNGDDRPGTWRRGDKAPECVWRPEGMWEDRVKRAHSSSALRGECESGVSESRDILEAGRAHAKASECSVCPGNQT